MYIKFNLFVHIYFFLYELVYVLLIVNTKKIAKLKTKKKYKIIYFTKIK